MIIKFDFYIFLVLTSLTICLSGPLAYFVPKTAPYITMFYYMALLYPMARSIYFLKKENGTWASFYFKIAAIYAGIIALCGTIHLVGLYSIPPNDPININGLKSFLAIKKSRSYLSYYIIFPAFLLSSYYFINKIIFNKIIRVIFFASFISSLIAIYQATLDHRFLSLWPNRYQGLDVDPNALAMLLYLAIPITLAGIAIEKKIWIKLSYIFGIIIFIDAINSTESRTFTAGALCLIILFPTIIAVAMRKWARWTRVSIASISVLTILFGILFPTTVNNALFHLGRGGIRLAYTYNKFIDAGLNGIFNHDELRGEHYNLALSLIHKAPLSGWGPAGYYLEAPNIWFEQTGMIKPIRDSAINHYLMIAGDFGLPATVLNLALIASPLLLGCFLLMRVKNDNQCLAITSIITGNTLFLLLINTMPPSYFISSLWIWSFELTFLLTTANHIGLNFTPKKFQKLKFLIINISIIIIIMALVGNYQTAFGKKYGYKARTKSTYLITTYPRAI